MNKRRLPVMHHAGFCLTLGLMLVFAVAPAHAQSGETKIQATPQITPPVKVKTEAKPEVKPEVPALSSDRIRSVAQTCFGCHGEGGISAIPTHPSIAGQKPTYIIKQMNNFRRSIPAPAPKPVDTAADASPKANKKVRDGRSDMIMAHFSSELTNADISPMAQYLSGLSCKAAEKAGAGKTPPPPPMPVPAAAHRCAACHGAGGISAQAHVPTLAGQQRGYLRRQLLLLRESAWGNNTNDTVEWRAHPIMEKQVARLHIEDVDTLAYYYAQLDCRGGQR